MAVPTNYQEVTDMLRTFKDPLSKCTVPLTAPDLFSVQNLPEFYQYASTDFVKVNALGRISAGLKAVREEILVLRSQRI